MTRSIENLSESARTIEGVARIANAQRELNERFIELGIDRLGVRSYSAFERVDREKSFLKAMRKLGGDATEVSHTDALGMILSRRDVDVLEAVDLGALWEQGYGSFLRQPKKTGRPTDQSA